MGQLATPHVTQLTLSWKNSLDEWSHCDVIRSSLSNSVALLPVTFLLGYVKSQVYANKLRTIQQLKAEIIPVIADVTPDIYERVIAIFIEFKDLVYNGVW